MSQNWKIFGMDFSARLSERSRCEQETMRQYMNTILFATNWCVHCTTIPWKYAIYSLDHCHYISLPCSWQTKTFLDIQTHLIHLNDFLVACVWLLSAECYWHLYATSVELRHFCRLHSCDGVDTSFVWITHEFRSRYSMSNFIMASGVRVGSTRDTRTVWRAQWLSAASHPLNWKHSRWTELVGVPHASQL